jgi:acetyl/propionyl-CoA carboxylase alpha subunit
MTYFYRLSGQAEVNEVRIVKELEGSDQVRYQIEIGGQTYLVSDVNLSDGVLFLTIDGQARQVVIGKQDHTIWLASGGQTYQLQPVEPRRRSGKASSGPTANRLEAVMPGTILEILVGEGEHVTQGQPLLVLEAMKMEQRLTAVGAGRVAQIHVQPGQLVQQTQLLMTFEPPEGDSSQRRQP